MWGFLIRREGRKLFLSLSNNFFITLVNKKGFEHAPRP